MLTHTALPGGSHLGGADQPKQRVSMARCGAFHVFTGPSGQLHGDIFAPGAAQHERVGALHVHLQRH